MTTATNQKTGERVELIDGEWEPIREGVANLFSTSRDQAGDRNVGLEIIKDADAAVRSVASGLTFGFADEVSASLNTAITGGTFEENLSSEKARDEEIPLALQIGGELTGALAATVLTGGVLGPTKVGHLFTKLPGWLQTTGLGALWGGLFGAGNAEGDLQDRLEGAATGAALGAVTGAVIHGGVRVGAAGVRGLKARLTPGINNARLLAEKFAQDNVSVKKVLARLRDLGPQATIADAAGANTLGLARGVAGVPGSAKEKITQTLKVRGLGESDRITKAVTRDLGPEDYFATEEAMLEKLRTGAREAYQEAYLANPSVASEQLDRIIQAPVAQAALKEAASIAEIERASGKVQWLGPVDQELTQLARMARDLAGKPPLLASGGVTPLRPGVASGLSLETWDYVKRGLDIVLDKPKNTNPLTGKLTKMGGAVSGLKSALLRALDSATGGEKSLYSAARAQYAGDAEVLTAIREGTEFMRLRPEAIRRKMADMSDAAQEAYRNGATRAILDVVEKTPDNVSVARRLFAAKMSRDRIRAVYPNKQKYIDLSRRLVAEQRFKETENLIGGGSRTAPMTAEMADGVSRVVGTFGAIAGSMSPVGRPLVMAGAGRQLAQRTLAATRGKSSNSMLAGWLVTRNRADQLRILDLVEKQVEQIALPPVGARAATLGAVQTEDRILGGQ